MLAKWEDPLTLDFRENFIRKNNQDNKIILICISIYKQSPS